MPTGTRSQCLMTLLCHSNQLCRITFVSRWNTKKGERQVDKTKAVCRHCSVEIVYASGNTTNLHMHLVRYHQSVSTWTNLIIQKTTHHQIFFEEKKKQQDRTHCIIFSKHQSYTEWSVFLDKTLLVSCSVNGTDTSRPIAA